MRRIPIERFWLDHLLATACGVMGVYAVAMSVAGTTLPMVLAAGVLLAGIAGYGLSLVVENTFAQKADGWLFAIFAIAGILKVRDINQMLPDGGFPFEIIAATMMFVILVAGGLFAWRDSTLLFTTLPSLVLFGLVGTIDTWRPGLFLFCGLILSIALLYARVHQRTMVQWAEEGGADRRYLHRDVWKWVAGPEYAFVAAGSIILFSFLGAPVVQGSLSGVSDAVRINVGQQIRRNFTPPNQNRAAAPDAPIGRGPVNLSDSLIAKVEIARPIYLRRQVYDSYSSRGWSASTNLTQSSSYDFAPNADSIGYAREGRPASKRINDYQEFLTYTYSSELGSDRLVPTPGEVVEIDSTQLDPVETSAGSLFFRNDTGAPSLKSVVAVVPEKEINTEARIPEVYMSSSVRAVYERYPETTKKRPTNSISRTGKSDYQVLYELKSLIAATCKYNTQTPAVPSDRDPVEYFLNDSKEGYCDLFASAFAIEARRLGFPTRYVTGYLMDSTQKNPDGTYHILEKHSHSWAEVYFEYFGWVPFDATEGAVDVTPEAGKKEGTSIFARIMTFIENNAAIITAVIIGLLLAGVYALLRNRGVSPLSGQDTARVLRHFSNRFQVSMERVSGSPKRFSQTLREFSDIHRTSLEPIWADVELFIPLIERAMFSEVGIAETELAELNGRLSELEKRAKLLQKERVQSARKLKRAP
jgi:hypothetical protein